MDARRAKQVIYGAFYLIIVFAVVYGVYARYFKVTTSCFDGIQNQGEMGVDCGGPCAKVCIPANLATISLVGKVLVLGSGQGHATLLAQVANKNAGFAAQSFGYRFDLFDATGGLIQSAPGQSFIYSGEVKYLIAPNVTLSGAVDHATLVIENPVWVPAVQLGFVPQFSLQALGPGPSSSSTISVSGELTNGDVAAFDNVLVIGVFSDDFGDVLGASQTILDHVAPNQTSAFSIIYPATPGIDLARTQLFAYALR